MMRPQALLLAAVVVFALLHRGRSVPESLGAQNKTPGVGPWVESNSTWATATYADVDAMATEHIHYAATALSNHSKKTLDEVLPKVGHVAKHYGLCVHLQHRICIQERQALCRCSRALRHEIPEG
jgi:hypothetical protein